MHTYIFKGDGYHVGLAGARGFDMIVVCGTLLDAILLVNLLNGGNADRRFASDLVKRINKVEPKCN